MNVGLLLEFHKAYGDQFLLRLAAALRVTRTQLHDVYELYAACGCDIQVAKAELERWMNESNDPLSMWVSITERIL